MPALLTIIVSLTGLMPSICPPNLAGLFASCLTKRSELYHYDDSLQDSILAYSAGSADLGPPMGPTIQEKLSDSSARLVSASRPRRRSRQSADIFIKRETLEELADLDNSLAMRDRKVKDRNKRCSSSTMAKETPRKICRTFAVFW